MFGLNFPPLIQFCHYWLEELLNNFVIHISSKECSVTLWSNQYLSVQDKLSDSTVERGIEVILNNNYIYLAFNSKVEYTAN